MFVIVPLFLSLFSLNDAVDFSIKTKENSEVTFTEGDDSIILRVYDLQNIILGGKCEGTCTINNSRNITTSCNFIDSPERHLNILIHERATTTFSGIWRCLYQSVDSLGTHFESFHLNVKVEPVDLSQLLPLPNLSIDDDDIVEFNITSPNAVNNFTLSEGNQTLVMFISGGANHFVDGPCNGRCDFNKKENISGLASSCSLYEKGYYGKLIFKLTVTRSYGGSWSCSVESLHEHRIIFNSKILIAVQAPKDTDVDIWLYVGIALGILVILFVIIGQTICIIHFKKKANKAEINKNLTPKNASDNSPDVRYVKKKSNAGEVRESVIYEALDTVKGKPIPPPIETLPVTPKMARSFSQNNLSVSPHEHISKTSPRPQKNQHNHGKFNTVDRSKSLERIKKRPPLPTPDEIYEVMAPGDAPEPTKSGWFRNKTQEQSPLLAVPQKKVLFGKNPPSPQDQRSPNSPNMGRKPGPRPTGTLPGHLPGPSGRPPPGAVLGGMPVLPSMISAANLRPVKKNIRSPIEQPPSDSRMPQPERMAVDARMQGRSPENMHGQFRMPQDARMQGNRNPEMQSEPRIGNFRTPQDTGPRMQESRFPGSRMQDPMQSGFRMPGTEDRFRIPEKQEGLRMPVDDRNEQTFNMARANPSPVPLTKPKPPVPLPSPDPEPIEQEPEMYYGSSDEEFDCYDVLPEYRIYGNAPPKKL